MGKFSVRVRVSLRMGLVFEHNNLLMACGEPFAKKTSASGNSPALGLLGLILGASNIARTTSTHVANSCLTNISVVTHTY